MKNVFVGPFLGKCPLAMTQMGPLVVPIQLDPQILKNHWLLTSKKTPQCCSSIYPPPNYAVLPILSPRTQGKEGNTIQGALPSPLKLQCSCMALWVWGWGTMEDMNEV